MGTWVGHSINERLEMRKPDHVRDLGNGMKEYEYSYYSIDPSCVHYWMVDKNGIIIGYRYEGKCRPIG